jgi:predicted O-methyltransferase YrrM
MADETALITSAHVAYLAARTRGDDAFLQSLKAAARAAHFPEIWIAPEQASFMQILLKLRGAREVVEVGTLAGYSAITLARALPAGGRLRTIEIDEARAAFAARWVAQSDVADRVEVLRGDAAGILPTFPDGSADAVFLDANKTGYPRYLREALRLLRPAGLVMVDNAFAFGELFASAPLEREAAAVREFNEVMARTPGLHSVIVPLGDGLWVGVKDS